MSGRSGESNAPVSVLIIDDSHHDREMLRRFLASDPRHDYVVQERTGIEEGMAAVLEVRPDCVLLDYSLGDGTGLDFLRSLPVAREAPRPAVVMLTGSGSEKVAADAFKAGARDYLVKDAVTPDSLQRAIAGAMFREKAERMLADQRKELERLFREAQDANARKDQFLAALSHELRTPLTPILTLVSSTHPSSLDREELEEAFATIRRNVELEARLIDDLLDLTRITNGKLQLNLHPTDAHEALRHALEICRPEMEAKGLRLTTELGATFTRVNADGARLQQVFWNLLRNALKFTPPGGEVSVRSYQGAGEELNVCISDTGIGISEEALPRIFDAFEQGGREITKRFGGLGLGLAIARSLMEAHMGSLRASSAGAGKGAAFTVTLPAQDGPAPESRDGISRDGVRRGKASRATGEGVVLLVEDHVASAGVLARTMRRHGYSVVVAHTIAEALDVFPRNPVRLIVSDIGLPDGTGVELMERIRGTSAVPAIALSGYGMDHDIAISHAVGFAEHLTKPVDWNHLAEVMGRLLAPAPAQADK